ncbi:MAG: hypothetical protein ABR976_12255 [Terracidiphilus sp.]|jgi:uncharacterized protein YdaU (DUF1376 family)
MNVDVAQELLNELGSSLENLETQHNALLQLLKDKRVVTEAKLAPYLAQAGKTSSVRWRAAHIRLERLFTTEKEREEKLTEEEQHRASAVQRPSQDQEKEAKSKNDKGEGAPRRDAADTNAATKGAEAQSELEQNKEQDQRSTSQDKQASPKQEKKDA